MHFMHIFSQKKAIWNTSIFERRRGPQTSRVTGKLSPLSPLSTAHVLRLFFSSPPMVIKLRAQIGDNIIHNRTVSDFQVKSKLLANN